MIYMLPLTPRAPATETAASDAARLTQAGLNPWLARCLAWRGVDTDMVAFEKHRLLPYSGLKGMDKMSFSLAKAVASGDKIVVVADYDCDGATACAIAVSGLRAFGGNVDFVVPNRFIHGYGLTPSVVDVVVERFPTVKWIVTVDNGIASVEGVAAANAKGLKVLVTDHHLPGSTLPDAEAIVNPNQPGCTFESKNLAGCGVMYYVLAAVRDVLSKNNALPASAPGMAEWLDLVALGTVADVVRLDANNRWLVQQGLKRIRQGATRPGIIALFEAAKRRPDAARAQDFGFGLGPRINAAGRLEDMSVGIQCLLSTDEPTAWELALSLDDLNRRRRQIEDGMKEIAEEALSLPGQENRFTRVAYGPAFHEGVVGIVAGRIKEQSGVPTVVFAPAQEEGLIKGSGRSIPEVHLRDVLDLVHKRGNGLFVKFGGHAMAAGVTLPLDRLEDFKALFEEATQQWLSGKLPQRFIEIDGELPASSLADQGTVDAISRQVWGQGFDEPIWEGVFEVEDANLVGADKNHLKMLVSIDGERFTAMQFFNDKLPASQRLRLAYKLSVNEFRGKRETNLMVVDAEPA